MSLFSNVCSSITGYTRYNFFMSLKKKVVQHSLVLLSVESCPLEREGIENKVLRERKEILLTKINN